ncbi:hypothetical protein Y032_0796g2399 [Ancylostoma ceylanicum]|uniref:Uncharacterized protein n=1 Tax=Ancylostoma ceylanicum TaxID=53326 RepID=A0A016WCM6_9BILA|nr:hypothetical protein Y032_0796g2399 [Ancylostoma ceylanicum]
MNSCLSSIAAAFLKTSVTPALTQYLSTNVNNDEAIHALLELLRVHHSEVHTFGLREDDLRELLLTTLACNIFQFDGKFYKQKRGLAMGLRISSLLAVIWIT